MTEQMVKQIRKILKKENVNVEATYHNRNGEFRVKVVSFINRSNFNAKITPAPTSERSKEAQEKIIKVLRALSTNGLRPEYRTEQREDTNAYGVWDCRYIIFK
jgi:hypothetical protein